MQLHAMCKAKLHRLTVTGADLNYEGSVTIDRSLLDAAAIRPQEMVQITNLANGTLWQTYVLPAPAGSGGVVLNGPPARLFHPGDHVIVLAQAWCTEDEIPSWRQRVVFVDDANRLLRVEMHHTPEDA